MNDKYNFGENLEEYSAKQGKKIPVWVTPKYTQTREKAIEIIDNYNDINASDFWILMNETKSGKMAYTGLIISHNACLKINDHLPQKDRFRPECVSIDKEGYGDSLVYTYCCKEQGIYEVGEVSKTNCKNAYPHAMALKRCMDRVILKACKLAYNGIYSDSEADEFREPLDSAEPKTEPKRTVITSRSTTNIHPVDVDPGQLAKQLLIEGAKCGFAKNQICQMLKVDSLTELTTDRLQNGIKYFSSIAEEKGVVND